MPLPCLVESLEPRRLLSAGALDAREVKRILAAAVSQAGKKQIIAVVDREGEVLGVFGRAHAKPSLSLGKAIARARTAAFFASAQNAFTPRTARFIIQDNFPFPVPNTPGGPLYGVQFSSLPGSDVFADGPAISAEPGGIPLFERGVPVGGIGVAGDMGDVAFRPDAAVDPLFNAEGRFYDGAEELDFDEAVALAGAREHMAPLSIRADRLFLDGLRFPFAADAPATGQPDRSFDELLAIGYATLLRADDFGRDSHRVRPSPPPPFPAATFAGFPGFLKNTNPAAASFGLLDSDDTRGGALRPERQRLTVADVERVIGDAVAQALNTRAGIRKPTGVHAQVHVAVVDRDGDLLGVFRMQDGTNFSFDVAVQKARTAAYFSDNDIAFSTRALGFLSQQFFPVGIKGAPVGPLFGLQNAISAAGFAAPLANGVTIFPGGIPLYKRGLLVGAIGVSGDGVDQDDLIATAGARRYAPPRAIRVDALEEAPIVAHVRARVGDLASRFALDPALVDEIGLRLDGGLDSVRLPYVKLPRNPDL